MSFACIFSLKLEVQLTHSCLNVMIDTLYSSLCCITRLIRDDQFFPSYESNVVFGDDLETVPSAFWSHAALHAMT